MVEESTDQVPAKQWVEVSAHLSAHELGTGLAPWSWAQEHAALLEAGAAAFATGVLKKWALPSLLSQKGKRHLGQPEPSFRQPCLHRNTLGGFKEDYRVWLSVT